VTHSIIYTVDDNNHLTAMKPAAPENEDTMQRLIADYPEIIADADGALLLIRREQPIADAEGSRWSLDHLFVTRAGVPVLIEMKRASDTRLRREVVGQMLDYAANATAHWQGGTIEASFTATMEATGRNPDQVLSEFLGDAAEPDTFWQQVDANFEAGRIKLVFVADIIPRELARIVEFLNEQMKADVRAVELRWFEGQGIRAFTPRVIGETERAQAAKVRTRAIRLLPIEREDWILKHLAPIGPELVEAAHKFCEAVEKAGGAARVTQAQGSLVAAFERPNTTLYPMSLAPSGKGMITFNLAYLKTRSAFVDEDIRAHLYNRLVEIVGPLSTNKLGGYPGFPAVRLNRITASNELVGFLLDISSMAC
jgi:hypothetical protein